MTERTDAKRAGLAQLGVVVSLGISQLIGYGSSLYLPAILAAPIAAEEGWPAVWVMAGLSVGMLVAGVVSARVGVLIQRHGGRPVMACSAVLIALGLLVMAAAPSVPVYLAGWTVMGFGMGGGLYDASFATLGAAYGSAARVAITRLTLIGGFASTISWPANMALVELLGWRWTCVAWAVLNLAVALPLYLVMLPRRNFEAGSEPAGRASVVVHPPVGTRSMLILLGVLLTVVALISGIVSVHFVRLLGGMGVDLASAVALGTLIGPAQVGARIIDMLLGTRHHPIWTMLVALATVALGMILLGAGVGWPALALLSYGAGNGLISIAKGTLPLALFGPTGYAVLMGRLAVSALIAQAIAPAAGTMFADAFGANTLVHTLAVMGLADVALGGALYVMIRRGRRRLVAAPTLASGG